MDSFKHSVLSRAAYLRALLHMSIRITFTPNHFFSHNI